MHTAPNIEVCYSLEFERLRVKTSLEKTSWFRKHGYNVLFPGNKTITDISETQNVSDLLNLIDTEYNQQYYDDIANTVKEQWQWFTDHWHKSPLNDIALTFDDTYKLFLTSYGVRGSYDLPNVIVINVRQREIERIAAVLFHEILHLSLEALIEEYSIPHWHKERLVDLYYKKIFPEKSFEQNLPKEVLQIDSIFHKHFLDPKETIGSISEHLTSLKS